MNNPQREQSHAQSVPGHRIAEMLLFLAASAVGIYGLGQVLAELFEPGKGISLLWLIVTAVALVILTAQMGRVHNTWPRRESKEKQEERHEEVVLQRRSQTERR